MSMESPAYVISADSHSAALFRQALQGLLDGCGVADSASLAVSQNGTPNMSVNVAAGIVYLAGTLGATSGFQGNANAQTAYGLPSGFTSQGAYMAYNDGTVNLGIAAADPTNPRIDLVCAAVQDAQYSGSNNQPVLQVITGTAAPSPSPPNAPASSLALAQVEVPAGASSIVTADITDVRPQITMNLRQVVRHVYVAGTTWTKQPGLRMARVICVGGGGSGAGGSGSFTRSAGSGGGAGEYREGWFAASALSATETVTVGAGAANVTGGFAGNNGGNTSFGSHITSNGGQGGAVNNVGATSGGGAAGGLGGTGGSGGDIAVAGGAGGGSWIVTNSTWNMVQAGFGGSNPLAGNAQAPASVGGGTHGLNYGGGGTGAIGSSADQTSGQGATGVVIVEEYY